MAMNKAASRRVGTVLIGVGAFFVAVGVYSFIQSLDILMLWSGLGFGLLVIVPGAFFLARSRQ